MNRRLGRIRSRSDTRTLNLWSYLHHDKLPAAPAQRDWTHAAPSWGMFRNSDVGDCTCAARAHLLQSEAANTGRQIAITDTDVIAAYSAVTGYDPAKPETDNGAQMIDVLRYERNVGIAGHKIGAFVKVDHTKREQMDAAINLFGGIYVGVDLPMAAQAQTVWDVGSGPAFQAGSWGGHAIAVLGYDAGHAIAVTWGAIKVMTAAWLDTYASEAWASVDQLWISDSGNAPSGFDAAALARDLEALGKVE